MSDPQNDALEIADPRQANSATTEPLTTAWKSEEQFRLMLDRIPTLVWRTSATGLAEFFNQRWYEYTGISVEDARGVGWMAAFHPDDLERLASRWMEIVTSEKPSELEARFRRRDGEYRWHLMRSEPLFDDQGKLASWCGTNTDIEDLKRAEGDLRRNKVYLEHVQRLSRTGGVGLRLSDREIFWSEETARIYGYDPTIPPTMEMVLNRVHPEDVELLTEIFRRAAKGGASFDFEHRLLLPDDSIRYLRNFAHSVIDEWGREEVLGAVIDITEQYHAKAALNEALARIKKSEGELRTIIDTIPTLAWCSPEDGLGDFFSKRWLDYTGLSLEEAQGTGWTIAIHPDDLGTLADTWTKIRASGKEGGLEARLRRSDGVYRWFLFRAAPLKNPDGGNVVWYGTNTDIEELKLAEAELLRREADLRKAQAELAHVTRVATLGELAASIAHEVGQPITGVALNADTCMLWLSRLREESVALVHAREALQRIIRDGAHAREVIIRLRALFKKTEPVKEPLEINTILDEVVALSQIEMEKRCVVLRMEPAPGLPRVLGDRVQLQQVLINLILNGIEAMSEVEDRPRELVIRTKLFGRAQVLTEVRDSGVGFDPAHIDQFFAAFHTTKPDGLGMGLSISRSIVENHGGQLWATANEGGGATFQFTLATYSPARGAPNSEP